MQLFEIVLYLRQVHMLLPTGGLFYFNFNDADYLALADDSHFESMLGRYVKNPAEATLMVWNSFTSLRGIAHRTGFDLKRVIKHDRAATSLALVKR
jgi:hypothetical protein